VSVSSGSCGRYGFRGFNYPSRIGICQVVVPLSIHLEIVEAHEGPFVVVVENRLPLQRDGIDGGEVRRFVWPAIGDDVEFTITVNAAVDIPCRRISLDSREIVGRKIEQVLPVVVLVFAFGRRAPLDEEQRVRLRYVAGGLVNLERKDLQLLNGGVRSDDIEKALVVGYKARCLDFLVAIDSLLAPARLEVSSPMANSRRSNSLIGHICC
jgi:hypothetical protein